MSAPVLRWLFIAQRMPKQFPALRTGRAKFRHPLRRAGGSPCSAGGSDQEPLRPTLRAIPFPKVTELFCRLPSATLFYRPEAANLGDLMRLWVRSRVKINLLLGFSWAAASAPVFSKDEKLYHRLSPTSKQDVSRGWQC